MLKQVLQNIKKVEQIKSCKCKKSEERLMCQTGTQFNSDQILKKKEKIHDYPIDTDSVSDEHICPLCGLVFKNLVKSDIFEEHVINHFTSNVLEDLI